VVEGDLYVGVFTSGSIREYSAAGADLGTFAAVFSSAEGMAFDQDADLFGADSQGGGEPAHNELWELSPTGGNPRVFATFGSANLATWPSMRRATST
jgi:hypothetical protein